MELIVDIHIGEDGRAAGTVRAVEQLEARTFSGNLEFLAVVESLYRPDDSSLIPTPNPRPMKGTSND
jgi:hypothetical protein